MSDVDVVTRGAPDLARRFGGVGRLYGETAALRFKNGRVCVAGVGGVGSWVAEALARSGVGHITLIDLDMVAESNANRQIQALDDTWGLAKVEAMRARIEAINPSCEVRCIEEFLTPENIPDFLPGFDVVIDAIDQVRVKVEMVAWCLKNTVPLVVVGAAGGKRDPARICEGDLANTTQDALLAKLRAQLRKEHGFSRDPKRKFGVRAIYSTEPTQRPAICAGEESGQGLSCAGYGSGVCVTAPFGFFAAAAALRVLQEEVV